MELQRDAFYVSHIIYWPWSYSRSHCHCIVFLLALQKCEISKRHRHQQPPRRLQLEIRSLRTFTTTELDMAKRITTGVKNESPLISQHLSTTLEQSTKTMQNLITKIYSIFPKYVIIFYNDKHAFRLYL